MGKSQKPTVPTVLTVPPEILVIRRCLLLILVDIFSPFPDMVTSMKSVATVRHYGARGDASHPQRRDACDARRRLSCQSRRLLSRPQGGGDKMMRY